MAERNLGKSILGVGFIAMVMHLAGCGGDVVASGGLPSDRQVIADVTPADKENVVAIEVTDADGEAYLHDRDLVWYYDRGVKVKRKAHLAEAPKAVVVVGGLARYIKVGDEYTYQRFLTTYNEYEGIPSPSGKALTKFVTANLQKVFQGRAHNIVEVESVKLTKDKSWVWHNPKSFTVPFVIQYDQVTSYTTVETREDEIDIRFYRQSVDADVDNLLATERNRKQLGVKEYEAEEVERLGRLVGR